MEKILLKPEAQKALDELNAIVFDLHRLIGAMDNLSLSPVFIDHLFEESEEFGDRVYRCIDICKSVYSRIIESATCTEN